MSAMRAVKEFFMILGATIGAAALVAALITSAVLLIRNDDTAETVPVAAARNDRPAPSEKSDPPPLPRVAEPAKEMVALPESCPESAAAEVPDPVEIWTGAPSGLTIRLVRHPSLEPVPWGEFALKVFRNDTMVPAAPQTTEQGEKIFFAGLSPAWYRFEAADGRGNEGRLTVRVDPGRQHERNLYVGDPVPIRLRAVCKSAGSPLAGASIDLSSSVTRGITDKDGRYRSKRSVVIDPGLSATISAAGYYTIIFFPFSDRQIRSKRTAGTTVALEPLGGTASLAGTAVNQDGAPLGLWNLRLMSISSTARQTEAVLFHETITNRKGRFEFHGLSAGQYLLEGTRQVWAASSRSVYPSLFRETVTVFENRTVDDAVLVCRVIPIRISGIVVSAGTRQPIPGVHLICPQEPAEGEGAIAGRTPLEALTDGAGFFSFDRDFLPSEAETVLLSSPVKLSLPGKQEEVIRIARKTGAVGALIHDLSRGIPIRLAISPPGSITLDGVVRDAGGGSLGNVLIEAEPAADLREKRYRALTGKEGIFSLQRLFPGTWTVTAHIPSGPVQRKVVTLLDAAPAQPLEFQAPGCCTVEGTVDLNEAPYFASISIRGKSYLITGVRLPKDGRFSFSFLPAGKAAITVESYTDQRLKEESLRIRSRSVELLEGASLSISL